MSLINKDGRQKNAHRLQVIPMCNGKNRQNLIMVCSSFKWSFDPFFSTLSFSKSTWVKDLYSFNQSMTTLPSKKTTKKAPTPNPSPRYTY